MSYTKTREEVADEIAAKNAVSTKRFIFTCKACKVTNAHDLAAQRINGRYLPTIRLMKAFSAIANCSGCGATREYVAVNGVKTEKVCSATCVSATGGTCNCACAGANHGGMFVTVA